MKKLIYVRAAELIIAVLLLVLVVLTFVIKAGESEIARVEDTWSDRVEEVDSVSIEPVEVVEPTITHLVEIKKPVVKVPVERVVEPEDLEADPIEVVPGEPESTVKYFDVPLDDELQNHIFAVCEEYGVDPCLAMAVIEKESYFKVDAVGDYGRSLGLMQVQPQWFKEEMAKHGFDNLLDPYQNVVIGIGYLAELFAMERGTDWALMAYNGGPAYANSMGSSVSMYVIEVKEMWAEYSAEMEE